MSTFKTVAMMVSVLALGAVASVSTAEAGGAAALARKSTGMVKPMREGKNVLAPFSFIRYCVESPDACPTGERQTLDWSESTKALVSGINRRVNAAIRPVNESSGDRWVDNVSAGDCEDFALTKRVDLLRAGLPASALRIAVATTASGEGHAVLVVKTVEGDFVLDNRTDRLLPWHKTDLNFIKITSAENPRLWRQLL